LTLMQEGGKSVVLTSLESPSLLAPCYSYCTGLQYSHVVE
jgi:hypothetical protein